MQVVTDWEDLKTIHWQAIFRCMEEYRQQYPGDTSENGYDLVHDHGHYNNYMKETWGIDHGTESVNIIDPKKYTMFLLRFT